MYYNYLRAPNVSTVVRSAFGGLNRNARIGDGEFSDMTNMTGDHAPLLAPREPRVIAQKQIVLTEETTAEDGTVQVTDTPLSLNGILGDVGFCAVWGTGFYYMGKKVDGIELADSPKKLLSMGAYILIYPDRVYYNTISGEIGETEETKANNSLKIFFNPGGIFSSTGRCNIFNSTKLPCDITIWMNKKKYYANAVTFLQDANNPYFIESCPESFECWDSMYAHFSYTTAVFSSKDGYLYYCSKAYITRRARGSGYYYYNFADCEWTKLDIRISLTSSEFEALGFDDADLDSIWAGNRHLNIQKREGGGWYDILNADVANVFEFKRLSYTGDDRIVDYYQLGIGLSSGAWKVRKTPVFDYVCVHENRLWGCRYGKQVDGEEPVNEIYCSALGNFKDLIFGTGANNAYKFSVGECGDFTGCVSLRGQLLFFKDDVVYRVTGTKPSNFQADKISDSGLQSGCEKTLEIIDGVLYYKSRNGVFAYDGSVPQKISNALGNFYYIDAVAGKHFSKYYITMVTGGKRCMYVYDTRSGLWHAEDNASVRFFTEYDGALYGAIGNDIVCLAGVPAAIFTAAEPESFVEWSVETGDIGLDSPYPKYYRRVLIRMDMELGTRVTVDLACDGNEWMQAADFESPRKQSFLMPIVTPRCDHVRMRIRGKGDAKIYSISYETETTGGNP